MLGVFVVMSMVVCCQSFDLDGGLSPDPAHFLRKYAVIKLYESCFGKEVMMQVDNQVN